MKYTVITLPQSERNFWQELKGFEYNVNVGRLNDNPRLDIIERNLSIMRKAVEDGDEWHTIIEDDVWFPNEKCLPHYYYCMTNVPYDADILLSCIYSGNAPHYTENLYWNKVIGQYAGHIFVAYSNKAMQKIIKHYEDKGLYGDFDWEMRNVGLNIYVPKLFFAIQHDGFSFHHNKQTKFNIENQMLSKIIK